MTQQSISHVVIVGGGSAGWMTAAALSKNLNPQQTKITLIESTHIGTVSVGEATIPQIRQFNAMLGINEDEFIKRTSGSFKLGIKFINWGHLGEEYAHPFGPYGVNMHGIPFYHYYLRAKTLQIPHPVSAYNLEYHALNQNKFSRPDSNTTSLLKNINYAYHFDATQYADFLKEYALKRGVECVDDSITRVNSHPNGDIKSVSFAARPDIAAPLFIDCSGFKGLLIEEACQVGYEDWRHWLPCDSAVAQPSARLDELYPYTKASARDAGWQWQIPLQHRIGNGHVFASQFMTADKATQILADNLPSPALAEPRTLNWCNGKRNKAWHNNVIAIGLSAGFIEPLESTGLQLIQSAIMRLLSLFPHQAINALDRAEYNKHTDFEIEKIRDFVILHYKATQREDTDFWRYVKHMRVPDSLSHKIDMYQQTGRIIRDSNELFDELSWFSVMHGQGIIPSHYHPLAANMTATELVGHMNNIQDAISHTVNAMPSHQAYINRITQ
jgi:tryptophan halogenase